MNDNHEARLTVIAAPISPCTTASPVDCTYRTRRKKPCLRNQVTSTVKEHGVSLKRSKITLRFLCSPLCLTLCAALYLFGSGSHVDYILYAVVKEVPCVLEVWRGILKHHQLCGVIDAR